MLLAMSNLYGAYSANATGAVVRVWTYGNVAAVMIDPMPATGCQYNDFFYIAPTVFSDVANRNYAHSISMTAMVTGKRVNVGYDKDGTGCYSGRPEIYRIDLMP